MVWYGMVWYGTCAYQLQETMFKITECGLWSMSLTATACELFKTSVVH